MKFLALLPLAALSTALVLPPEEVLNQAAIEDHHEATWAEDAEEMSENILGGLKHSLEELSQTSKKAWNEVTKLSNNAFDDAMDKVGEVGDSFQQTIFDAESWIESEFEDPALAFDDPHHGPPHHGPPGHGKRPHHPPHHGHEKPNLTVYQLIAGSKYTTKLAKLISEYDDLVDALNSTKANYTIFAPTDKAFEKIPDHVPKPSKEFLKKLLEYHVVPGFYPAGRVLATHTVPTLLKSDSLGSEPLPQRLSFHIGFKGLNVNFYSRVIAINIFGTNGVIHGVDSLILPPPPVLKIIDLLPAEFSTLELGLVKTGLYDLLNTTDHAGGTFFAPSNFAFKKLGPRINAFLFSPYGLKYLKALLEYHVVPDNTLYSDAYYKAGSGDDEVENVPKGYFHIDLPTLLDDRHLAIDVARYGGFIRIKINAFSTVTVQDGVAKDGVVHVVSDVLIPPKKVDGVKHLDFWEGGEIEVEDLKQRLEPFVVKNDL
ncbi:FAS1 domain-containing protein [Polychaeton citri CBS 116435]|uniref:FAS1 domain-containing protein n=1 Tax=Polychaeton citri CBS 116435 TaxID=1314669 RepID=A0A9P4Q7U4_9PEZI|nr:FAS1 domain-containing protein [Polychaeton citri CBS 116435]